MPSVRTVSPYARCARPAAQADWCGTSNRERTNRQDRLSFVRDSDVPATPRCGAASSVSARSASSALIVVDPLPESPYIAH